MNKMIMCTSKNGKFFMRTVGKRRLRMWKTERKEVGGVRYERSVYFKPHPYREQKKVVKSRSEWKVVDTLDGLWGSAPSEPQITSTVSASGAQSLSASS